MPEVAQFEADMSAPSGPEIKRQLARIFESPDFQKAKRLKEFLCFVVNEKLGGRADKLKAYTIGLEVFDRPESFDPITDTIVRVNAGKLRRALERYYLGLGRQDEILITIPKGRYIPLVTIRNFEITRRGGIKARLPSQKPDRIMKPTIAVLPFRKINLESSNEFIIHGFGEELTMALSRFSGLKVLAYYSTSGIQMKRYGEDQLRRMFSAAFYITGSIYQDTAGLRLNVELVRTDNFQHVWSRSYDRSFSTSTIFIIRDDIIQNIVASVADDYGVIPKIISNSSLAKDVDKLESYEAVMRYHHYGITLSSEAYKEALQALEKTVVEDSGYGLAWALLSILYLDAFTFSIADVSDPLNSALECAEQAISIDPMCQHAYYSMCYAQLMQRNEEEVIRNTYKILEINPNAGLMVGIAGWFLSMAGKFEEGFQLIDQSRQLSPIFPTWFHFPYYLNAYLEGRYDDALESVKKFGLPSFFWQPLMRSAALGQQGRIPEAQTALQELISLKPDFPSKASFYVSCFLIRDKWVSHILEGLSAAGL